MNGTESLVETCANELRARIISGELKPQMRLSEQKLAADLNVSRNTLREVFRLLTSEGLLKHRPNHGVSVAKPTMATVVEIYRVRKLIEVAVLRQAWMNDPGIQRMRDAVIKAEELAAEQDWRGVGSANMEFHMAIIALSGSARLISFFSQIFAELRLAFGLIENAEKFHVPYIHRNFEIITQIERGDANLAADLLDRYLVVSESALLNTLNRPGFTGE